MSPTQKAWSYILVTPPANLAVPIEEVREWLKNPPVAQNDEITALIKGATLTGERITRRDFINKTYKTYRDKFSDYISPYPHYGALVPGYQASYDSGSFELKKSKLQAVNSVKYLKETVLTLVSSSIYYSTEETDFSKILLLEGESWPNDLDNRQQAVVIEFVAGYGADDESVPGDIKTAIKQHVLNAFSNRGDCSDDTFLPNGARATYQLNRIMDIV